MVKYYLKGFQNYFNFKGRARRKEFWAFNGLNLLIAGLYVFLGIYFKFSENRYLIDWIFGVLGLIMVIPILASMVRRLHDTSRGGVYMFLGLIPILGLVLLLIFFLQDSVASYNDYGEYPKFKKNEF